MQIFSNGTLRYTSKSSVEDIDDNGNPIRAEEADMDVPCTINVLSEGRSGRYDDGAYKKSSYRVTCDMEEVGSSFHPNSLQLIHSFKGDLGMFQVQRIEYYELTGTVEIWV